MPNHIKNRLIINADNQSVKEVLEFLKGKPYDDGSPCYIDFNKIIPLPENLMIDSSILGEDGMRYLLAKQKTFKNNQDEYVINHFELLNEEVRNKALEIGGKYLKNIADYGFKDWYDWSIENWETKWNAYNQDFDSPNIISFDTAWNGVVELMKVLSCKFPNVEFQYAYADENTGSNTGTGIIKNGIDKIHYPKDQSNEAYELAFELRPEDCEYYELTNNGYEYIEEEEEEEEEQE